MGVSIPVEESSVLVEESSVPVEESPVPVEESPVPVEESPVPVEESPVPGLEDSGSVGSTTRSASVTAGSVTRNLPCRLSAQFTLTLMSRAP